MEWIVITVILILLGIGLIASPARSNLLHTHTLLTDQLERETEQRLNEKNSYYR